MLWLYGENDSFYTPEHSRASYDAFVGAGGRGSFRLYRRADPLANGRFIMDEPALWRDDVGAFVETVDQGGVTP